MNNLKDMSDDIADGADVAEDGEKKPRIQSVARGAQILFAVASSERGLSRKEISRAVKLSAQTTYHLLHTLSQTGLVARNDEGNYVLGLRIGSLAEGFGRQLAGGPQVSAIVRNVARLTNETTYAARWINGEAVSIDIVRGRYPIQALEVPQGFSEDAHSRAGGKVLLAYASEDQRREYFKSHTLKRRTPHTTCTLKALEKQLADIRALGYAAEREEFAVGLCCVAIPLDNGLSPYAIGISAPVNRFEEKFDFYLNTLRGCAAKAMPAP